ncbi:hypothetical protein CDAR_58471 [Caerostris darwini]|uniref:Uncharacterized protein n=1 Tax=Caerostris darwini TaxID=1538125 RepID=A0AAV4U779_9ARAC|nr:hypothetical protein CDAR_58471 [Caerostris darwini]
MPAEKEESLMRELAAGRSPPEFLHFHLFYFRTAVVLSIETSSWNTSFRCTAADQLSNERGVSCYRAFSPIVSFHKQRRKQPLLTPWMNGPLGKALGEQCFASETLTFTPDLCFLVFSFLVLWVTYHLT